MKKLHLKPLLAALFITTAGVTTRAALTEADLKLPVVSGPYAGTMESLTIYSCPDWFRDAKLGIWAHWGPHAVTDGNLLLDVVQRADGSIDPEVETILHGLADWTTVNGETIYGTRPWLVYGEGPNRVDKSGAFNGDKVKYGAKDIRFTTKGEVLYAIALGWPVENKIVIRSLAKTADASVNQIESIELLGNQGELKFILTCSLKITGSKLKPAPLK